MPQHGDSMISVIILAKNEKKTIPACIESVRWTDEIIVLDSGSLAKTCLGGVWMFFRSYIVRRGFLNGSGAFLLTLFKAQGTFYRGIKQPCSDEFRPEGAA